MTLFGDEPRWCAHGRDVGVCPFCHARSDDPATSIEAALLAEADMGRRMAEVVAYFAANRHRWIDKREFTCPAVGGDQGDRRLRDAAAAGYGFAYEARAFDGRWWYRADEIDGEPVPEPPPPTPLPPCRCCGGSGLGG